MFFNNLKKDTESKIGFDQKRKLKVLLIYNLV